MNKIKRYIYENIIPFFGKLMVSRNKYCNVIYYHDIVQGEGQSYMRININIFKKHMQYLKNHGYETLRFDDLNNSDNFKFKKKRILITFDDGWKSNYTEIFEYMKSLGLKYNVFLAIGLINVNSNYLTWEMIRDMHISGICGFGTHTYNHVDLSNISEEKYNIEIIKSNEIFKNNLGYLPTDFCFPFGKYSKEAIDKLIKESPYLRIYTSDMRYSYKKSNKFIMGRNGINNSEPMNIFKSKLKAYFNVFSLIKK